MPRFRLTKKLATALRVPAGAPAEWDENPEHDWFADIFHIERKRCVIWTHRTTLLTLVRPAITPAELRDFHNTFRAELTTTVAAFGLPAFVLDRFDSRGPVSFASTNDRAVVGSMLDCRTMFQYCVADDGGLARADLRRIIMLLSDTPMSVLGGDSAIGAIAKLSASRPALH